MTVVAASDDSHTNSSSSGSSSNNSSNVALDGGDGGSGDGGAVGDGLANPEFAFRFPVPQAPLPPLPQHPAQQQLQQQHPRMNPNPMSTVYATKRRRRSNKSLRPTPRETVPTGHGGPGGGGGGGGGGAGGGGGQQPKSNPSKRHRERLNGELDHLASLLPFEQNILSKLDRLSILRLAVAFLRTKAYFIEAHPPEMLKEEHMNDSPFRNSYNHPFFEARFPIDVDNIQEAFKQNNQFLMILDCSGELFFATQSIEHCLGFHQSDVIHQSVYELVHSEDREELQRQLTWNAFSTQEDPNLTLAHLMSPENSHYLERSFTIRFRCLLDNTSGFLRLDIRGRIKELLGQKNMKKGDEPPLALFCFCTPFGPPSLLEMPAKELIFRSKHKLNFGFISMDIRGREMMGYEDTDISQLSGYDLVHHDDLQYVASAHAELIKTGASGMIAYRLLTKDLKWQWLQTSSKLVYKNSKPDFIISTHREEEGLDLYTKRTMDFKVTYLDAGLTSNYLSDGELGGGGGGGGATNGSTGGGGANASSSAKIPKKWKGYKDSGPFRGSKRKNAASANAAAQAAAAAVAAHHAAADIYNSPASVTDAAAAAVAAPSIAASYAYPYAAAAAADNPLYQQGAAAAYHFSAASPYQSLYSPVAAAAAENRYFPPAADYLASYRSLTSHYPEYAAANPYITGNSYLDVTSTTRSLSALPYDASQLRYFESEKVAAAASPATPPPLTKRGDKKGDKDSVKSEPMTPSSHQPYDYVPAPPPPPPIARSEFDDSPSAAAHK